MLPGKVVRAAWAFLNDCFFSSLCITARPEELACACLCISLSQQQQHLRYGGTADALTVSVVDAGERSGGSSGGDLTDITESTTVNIRGSESLAKDWILQDVQNNYKGRWAKECPWRLFGVKDEVVLRSIEVILDMNSGPHK